MNNDLLTIKQTQKITIKMIEPLLVREICQSMNTTLPQRLHSPENEQPHRFYFVACINNEYVGIISIKFATSSNAHIDWMFINQIDHFQSIGTKLLLTAENYCYESGYSSITAAIVRPKNNDLSNLKYQDVYEQSGYKPLFEMYTDDPHQLMIYMHKILTLDDFVFVDLTHTLTSDIPHWGIDVGFKYNARFIQGTETTSPVKFRVQRLEMSAGIGTHMDAPSHCFEQAAAIDDIPIQSLITICRMIDVSSKAHDQYSVAVDDILQFENNFGTIPKHAFVILYTGWDQRWQQPEKYRNDKIFPNISIEAAKLLLSRDIVGLGIDTLSPDAFGSEFPVHSLILGAGKYIIENIANAKQLDPIGNYIFAFPIKIAGGTEAPMRLIGMKRKLVVS